MPSAFETMFANSRALLLALHGTPVLYSGSTVSAIVGAVAEEFLELASDGRFERFRHRPVTVSLADVAAPARPDQVTIDGEVWTVHERLPQDGGMARVTVIRPVRVEVGGRSGPR